MNRPIIAAAFLALAGGPAGAATIDFAELAGPALQDIGQSHATPQGYTLSIAADPAFGMNAYLLVWADTDPANADPGGATITTGFTGNIVTLRRTDGTAFDFASIDLADPFAAAVGGDIGFTFTTADGAVDSFLLTRPDVAGLTTHVFARTGLRSVSWQGVSTRGPWVQFDNIVVAAAGIIPEPASWALMIAGFGLSGAALRRRRSHPA